MSRHPYTPTPTLLPMALIAPKRCCYVVGTAAPKFNGSIFVGGGARVCARLATGPKYCTQHAQIVRRYPRTFWGEENLTERMKATRIIKFRRGTEMEDTGWHLEHNPTGNDTTLFGLAWEGMCSGPTIRVPYDAKQGRPTCRHCVEIVKFCLTLK